MLELSRIKDCVRSLLYIFQTSLTKESKRFWWDYIFLLYKDNLNNIRFLKLRTETIVFLKLCFIAKGGEKKICFDYFYEKWKNLDSHFVVGKKWWFQSFLKSGLAPEFKSRQTFLLFFSVFSETCWNFLRLDNFFQAFFLIQKFFSWDWPNESQHKISYVATGQ